MMMDAEHEQLVDGGQSRSYTETVTVPTDDNEERGWRGRLMYSEPALFLAGLAVFGFVQLNQEYLYYRVEGSQDYPRWFQDLLDGEGGEAGDGCGASSNQSDLLLNAETEISTESAYLSTKLTLFREIPPVFLTLILCSYTDTVGRKFGIVLPAIGGLLNSLTYLLVEYYSAPLEWLYFGNLLEGLSGGHLTLVGSGFAYVYDTIKPGTVSYRFTLYQSVFFLASAIASLIIGYIIDGLGYIAAFWFLIISYLLIIIYTIVILPESLPKKFRKPFNLLQVAKNTIAGFQVFFRDRPKKTDKLSLMFIFIVAMVISIIATGNYNLQTVYAESPPFCLNSIQIGTLLAISSALTVIIPPIEIRIWGLFFRDELFPFLCLVIQTCIFIFEGLANTPTLLYIAVALIAIGSPVLPLCRALMSKVADPEEQGAIQASISCLNAIGELISETVLIALYAATEAFYFGTVNFVIAFLLALCAVLFFPVWYWRRNDPDVKL